MRYKNERIIKEIRLNTGIGHKYTEKQYFD